MGVDDGFDVDWRPFGWSTPRLLLAGLLIALLIVLFVAGSTSTAGFSPYNADWDGNSEFRGLADSRGELVVATSASRYEGVDPATTTAFVFAPDRAYATNDATRVREFVDAGGTLVVADNYGPHGNALLAEVGATARFDGRILRDERNNYRSPSFPIVSDISSHPLVEGVDALTLNYGTAVNPGGATPLGNSSSVSYLAASENDTLDDDTELRQYPVATVEAVGDGRVIVVGDPSLFINSMLDQSSNRRFVSGLLKQRTVTLLDQSHSASLPPLVGATLALRSSPATAAAVTALLIGLVVGIGHQYGRQQWVPWLPWRQWVASIRSTLMPTRAQSQSAAAVETGPLRADPEALRARLRERHPDWDEERLDRVIAGVLSADTDSSDNE